MFSSQETVLLALVSLALGGETYGDHYGDEEQGAHLTHHENDQIAYAHPAQVVAAPVEIHKAKVLEVPEVHYKPQPYSFGYEIKDNHHEGAGEQWRHEYGDEHGTKRGSYGYRDAWGIYRQVDYIADSLGFRATIKTNEPGTANQDPAAVKIKAEPSPYHEVPATKSTIVKQVHVPVKAYEVADPYHHEPQKAYQVVKTYEEEEPERNYEEVDHNDYQEVPEKAYAHPVQVKTPVYHTVRELQAEHSQPEYQYESYGNGGYGGRKVDYGTRRRAHQLGAIYVAKVK